VQISDLTILGKIIKARGFNGAVMIALEAGFVEEIKKMESVFVAIDGLPVPFFMDEIREAAKDSVIVKFAYYDSDLKVEELVGCNVFSDSELNSPIEESDVTLSYIGYSLADSNGRLLGIISKILSFPMQTMLELESKKGSQPSILIPFNEDWVLEINTQDKIIIMLLPEGIESINN